MRETRRTRRAHHLCIVTSSRVATHAQWCTGENKTRRTRTLAEFEIESNVRTPPFICIFPIKCLLRPSVFYYFVFGIYLCKCSCSFLSALPIDSNVQSCTCLTSDLATLIFIGYRFCSSTVYFLFST